MVYTLQQRSFFVHTTITPEQAQHYTNLPFMELLYTAHSIHRKHFDPSTIQASALLNIKNGNCSEDCSYCAQSAKYTTSKQKATFVDKATVLQRAQAAKNLGATRFCMGAAGRSPHGDDITYVCSLIRAVKELGLEVCVTLGMLNETDVQQLKEAGLDYYNHNIDTSAQHYTNIVTTHSFEERIHTLHLLHAAGIHICSGGILGIGEQLGDRVNMLLTLANLPEPPQSIPINILVPIPNTPLEHTPPLDPLEAVRTIALARILMPKSFIRLAAGRTKLSETAQALCFFAGANSIFIGETLLTTPNATPSDDALLFEKLNLRLQQ